jgi:hypothetical protein
LNSIFSGNDGSAAQSGRDRTRSWQTFEDSFEISTPIFIPNSFVCNFRRILLADKLFSHAGAVPVAHEFVGIEADGFDRCFRDAGPNG